MKMNKKRFEKVSPLPNAPPPSEFGGRTTEEAKQGRKEGEEAIMTYGDGSLRRQPNGHQLSSLSLLSVCLTPLPLPPHSSIPSCFQTLTVGQSRFIYIIKLCFLFCFFYIYIYIFGVWRFIYASILYEL